MSRSIAEALAALLDVPLELSRLRTEVAELKQQLADMARAQPIQLVDVPTAATRLGLSVSTVKRRIKDGSIPVERRGRSVRIDLANLRPVSDEEIERLARDARRAA